MHHDHLDAITKKRESNNRLVALLRDPYTYNRYCQRMAALGEAVFPSIYFDSLACRLEDCGAEFVIVYCPTTRIIIEYRPRNRCESHFCAFCCGRQGRVWRRNNVGRVLSYSNTHQTGLSFLTLTFRPSDKPMSFRALYEDSAALFSKLRKHPYWRAHVRAAIAFYEAPWRTDQFLRHFHVVAFGAPNLHQVHELAEAWRSVGGGHAQNQAVQSIDDIPRIAQYALKGFWTTEVPGPMILEAIALRYGRQFAQMFGELRGRRWRTSDSSQDP